MHALSGERILVAWERGRERAEPWRALALLEAALPELNAEDLAVLPLADRNAQLLRLRSITFGGSIEGFAVCPDCGAQLEFALQADDLEKAMHAPPEETWTEQETKIAMRPLNTRDLAVALETFNDDDARAMLLARTISPPEKASVALERSDWLERFERLNASAEIRCVLPCGECGRRPVLDLDIASFLWREVALTARRLLAEIHRLAAVYGWSEQAILAMSAARRAAYLEMLEA